MALGWVEAGIRANGVFVLAAGLGESLGELLELLVFLASPAAAVMTGQMLRLGVPGRVPSSDG
ncbi:hypothetical protein [Salinactinospora qingdaonensis]|uniref:Uncharacterized protein n=1 Tax=Salinactinospora qingdaonensis TaxID=702744 RepID=A0ABP7F5K0_9ACTN